MLSVQRGVSVACGMFFVRRPVQTMPSPLLTGALDVAGIAAASFASLLGANAAKKKGMSTAGALTVGAICGAGGGTVRDCLLGKKAFWLDQPGFVWMCVVSGLVGVYGWESIKRRLGVTDYNALFKNVFVASLGGCALAGAATSFAESSSKKGDINSAALFAMLSACGGGVVADLLMGNRPMAFYPEGLPWILPSAAGAAVFMGCTKVVGVRSLNARIAIAAASAVALNQAMTCNYPWKKNWDKWSSSASAWITSKCYPDTKKQQKKKDSKK